MEPGPLRPRRTECNLETNDTPEAELAVDRINGLCEADLSTDKNEPNSPRFSVIFPLSWIGLESFLGMSSESSLRCLLGPFKYYVSTF